MKFKRPEEMGGPLPERRFQPESVKRENQINGKSTDMGQEASETLAVTGQERIKEERIYIDMDLIQPNSKNEYSTEDLEDLAAAIKMAGGIWQDLIVKPQNEDGYYVLTTGERRWRAACLLRDRGEYPEKYQGKVPCQIKDTSDLPLQLGEENKENFMILVTNKYRDKTDADLFMEMQKWKSIFLELRKNGVEQFSLGEEAILMKGTKTRDLIAQQMDLSNGQIAKMERVEKYAAPEVMDQLMKNEISLSEAERVASLPKEKQVERLKGEPEEVHPVTKKEVSEVLLEMERNLSFDVKELTERRYREYCKCIKNLKKILGEEDR